MDDLARLLGWFVRQRREIRREFELDHLQLVQGEADFEIEFHVIGDFRLDPKDGKKKPIVYRTECVSRFRDCLEY